MIRIGLIGCGTWGWRYIPAAREASTARVTHAVRADRAPPEARGYLNDVRIVDDWRSLLNERIDAFVVATPPSSHAEICSALLDAGRPVMVEKPVALNLGSAMWIAKAATDANVPLLINHQHLFSPAYEELRAETMHWRDCQTLSIGGGQGPYRDYSALWDYGSHDVAMVLGLSHKPWDTQVRATHVEDEYRLTLQTGKVVGFLRVWNNGEKRRTFMVANSRGDVAVYDDLDPKGVKLRLNHKPVQIAGERPLTRAVRAFARACATGQRDWRFDPTFGVEVTRVLEQADQLAKERSHGDDD